jgi:hypothetical protein
VEKRKRKDESNKGVMRGRIARRIFVHVHTRRMAERE